MEIECNALCNSQWLNMILAYVLICMCMCTDCIQFSKLQLRKINGKFIFFCVYKRQMHACMFAMIISVIDFNKIIFHCLMLIDWHFYSTNVVLFHWKFIFSYGAVWFDGNCNVIGYIFMLSGA